MNTKGILYKLRVKNGWPQEEAERILRFDGRYPAEERVAFCSP